MKIVDLLRKRKRTRTKRVKSFSPCDLCTIGVGESILDGVVHTHMNKVNYLKHGDSVYTVCDQCIKFSKKKVTEILERLLEVTTR